MGRCKYSIELKTIRSTVLLGVLLQKPSRSYSMNLLSQIPRNEQKFSFQVAAL